MTTEAEVHPTGTSTIRSDPREKNRADRFQEPDMETIKTGAQFSQKSQKNCIPIIEVLENKDAMVTPSMPAHTQTNLEQAPHVAANRTLRTWKRPTATERHGDEDLEVLPELPIKKIQRLQIDDGEWQRLQIDDGEWKRIADR
nr:hypothetical protein CFP56_57332 [Quercus suber]